jgi:hypothetical protein
LKLQQTSFLHFRRCAAKTQLSCQHPLFSNSTFPALASHVLFFTGEDAAMASSARSATSAGLPKSRSASRTKLQSSCGAAHLQRMWMSRMIEDYTAVKAILLLAMTRRRSECLFDICLHDFSSDDEALSFN